MKKRKRIIAYPAVLFSLITLLWGILSLPALGNGEAEESISNIGGGYAVTGQLENAGYTTKLYDETNGLPTSDANFILGASSGYIWIGSYSGILRYDGSVFTRMDPTTGLTSGCGLYEDSHGRIWVATNDNGVAVIDGNNTVHLTYEDGLPSSSIRCFAEDGNGNVFIGTTAGVCYADEAMQLHTIEEERLQDERILKLDTDASGRIYGLTKNGLLFMIEAQNLTAIYTCEELGMEKVTAMLADPKNDGRLYFCTEGSKIYYGSFGEHMDSMKHVNISPLSDVRWISYDCDRIWLASSEQIAYLDEMEFLHIVPELPINSGIEMITSDFQGNIWVASSTQGIMKIVTNTLVNIYSEAGLSPEVTNAVCFHKGLLYIGTDNGLRLLDRNGQPTENRLSNDLKNARICCITEGLNGDLWLATDSNELGLICYKDNGTIINYTKENGLPDNEVHCVLAREDGIVLAGTNSGLAILLNGEIIKTFGKRDGVNNTSVLTAEEGTDGSIYFGTDGDGLYKIYGSELQRLGREDGLTSDVIVRLKRDDLHDVLWVITSNSIEYIKDGIITQVTSFPYNDNYDILWDQNNHMWIVSSCGVYCVAAEDMLWNNVRDYRLYSTTNGLDSTPTSMCYCTLSENGDLYITGRSGVSSLNTEHSYEDNIPIRIAISSVYCGEKQIFPDEYGIYNLPATGGRIRITASVFDYTLLNPIVNVYMEGKENEGTTVFRDELQTIEYTGLSYGKYTLHIRVLVPMGKNLLYDTAYTISKQPRLTEYPLFRLLFFLFVVTATGIIVWRVIHSTVIRRQYDEIIRAKEEAERANNAKSRFLANISHEIRTPINTIMGMNEMAMREDASGVPKPYFMSMINYALDIRSASESLLSLINDLLDMSKIESGKMHLVNQEYDSQELLRSIVSMIRARSTEKELTFDVTVDEILPVRLYGDSGKIRQIVVNLLSNALKYTSVGGFALNVYMDERVDEECKLRFSVKDTGIGVREADLDKLFNAYERLDEQKNSSIQGTGLGLDISHRFAELMCGTLRCESSYGEGSEFIFTVTQRIVDASPIGLFTEHDDSAKGPYIPQFIAPDADILVVDDTPANLTVIKGLLKATRVFVSTALSGEECLEKLKDTRYNVVFLDHMMPGMDGVETLAEIRKTDPYLPVYALTANASYSEDFYTSKGFNGYLMKPVDSITLEKTIMRHLPEEIMQKPSQEQAIMALTELPESLLWIKETEGISTEEGIKNSGSIPNFIFSLNLFLDTIDANAAVIREALDSGNNRLFGIKVHSLKSSARFVGAMKLAELSAMMEEASNRQDQDFILSNVDQLLEEYESYKERLARLHTQEEKDS